MEGELDVATVWGSTWVPGRHPLMEGEGSGYAVAWIEFDDGQRVQHLVVGDEAPPPGTQGEVRVDAFGGWDVPVFVPEGAGR